MYGSTQSTHEVFNLVEDLKRDIKDDNGNVKEFSDIDCDKYKKIREGIRTASRRDKL